MKKLIDAMEHPEKEEYQNYFKGFYKNIQKITCLLCTKKIQRDIVSLIQIKRGKKHGHFSSDRYAERFY